MAREAELMDAEIWGELQNYIDLKHIYTKLPMEEFFQLRLVCKDWDRLASDREVLEDTFKDPIAEPYFYLRNVPGYRNCLLAYDTTCSGWKWTRLPRVERALAGLFYSRYRVFNVHTRVFHALPPPPNEEGAYNYEDCMIVDTSANPYSFQIILCGRKAGTCIYDSKSNSWTRRLSKPIALYMSVSAGVISCAHCNGVLYILLWDDEYFVTWLEAYNLEKDEWEVVEAAEGVCFGRDIGAWQNSLLVVGDGYERGAIILWKLADHSKNEWAMFDQMPDDLRSWLQYDDEVDHSEMTASFCGEFVLFYTWVWDGKMGQDPKFVMCNLDKKIWEKVDCSQLLEL